MNNINDNHIKFEVSLHFGGIWPTVRRRRPRQDHHHGQSLEVKPQTSLMFSVTATTGWRGNSPAGHQVLTK